MQIKGNEFLKNVQKKQEREELEKRLQKLQMKIVTLKMNLKLLSKMHLSFNQKV